MDREPRQEFSATDIELLLDISSVATDEIYLSSGGFARAMEESQRYVCLPHRPFVCEHEQLATLKTRFITCTSHELNTPLTVFKLSTQVFLDHVADLHAQRYYCLQCPQQQ
jgi:hypothetical protein